MQSLKSVLESSNEKELKGLAEILGTKDSKPEVVMAMLWWNSRSIFGMFLRKMPTYVDIAKQVAKKLKVKYEEKDGVETIETKISQKVFQTMWKKMTNEQREELDKKMQEVAKKFDKSGSMVGSVSMLGALSAAQLSGFGVYLLASTSLGALSGAIGIALPFTIYTTMSSAISVIIGPAGWIGAGLFAIWKLTGPNYKKLIPAIIYLNMLRSKQKLEL
ncbi:MAG: hypothetical protein NTX22_06165 [Ignavibacteriales bacterium]|nr:hypothetical protein [Ignavibacteriales bacterium]